MVKRGKKKGKPRPMSISTKFSRTKFNFSPSIYSLLGLDKILVKTGPVHYEPTLCSKFAEDMCVQVILMF